MFLSIPRTAARRESRGTRDTTPVCAKFFTAGRRCTRYWRRAPCLLAQHTRGPLTQAPRGVHRTRLCDPITGISRRATVGPLQRNAGAVQNRTTREGLKALRRHRRSDPRSAHHFAASRGEKPPSTRRRAVVERRHCQQAASNDARVCPAFRLDKRGIRAGASRRSCRQPCAGAQSERPARCRASAGDHRRRSNRVAMKRRVHVHRGLRSCNAHPLGGTQSDSRSDELKRRATTATPVRSPIEQGKEPRENFELTTHECVRQEDATDSRLFAGDFAWHLYTSLLVA